MRLNIVPALAAAPILYTDFPVVSHADATTNLHLVRNGVQTYMITLFLLLFSFPIFAETTRTIAPVVSNISALQRSDGSKIVDVYYDLFDANGDLCDITLKLSSDGGSNHNIIPSPANLSGDFGDDLPSGTNKHIIWNAGAENYSLDSSYLYQVFAEDGYSPPMPENFVFVEGGTFDNGTSDVTISSFYIDKYELTQAGYQAVMGSNPAFGYGVGSNYPVYHVSWFNAIEYSNRRSMAEGLAPCYNYLTYGTNPDTWPAGWNSSDVNHSNVVCNWAANGYRLPTEMERMFASRGGNQTHNYTYSGSNDVNAVAWNSSNSGSNTHAVGSKTANELGLYDMSGNVWEWSWDIYGTYPSGSQTNPHGAVSGPVRVRRGGCWNDAAYECRVSSRSNTQPIVSSSELGFRICRVLPTPPTPLDNFVYVEGGTFNNGTSDVTISSFYIDKYELTQAGYQAVMGSNPASGYGVGSNCPVYNVSWFKAIEYSNRRSMQEGLTPCYSYLYFGTNPDNWPGGWNTSSTNHTNVSCYWAANGYRLPTEMEWQFAAQGGIQTHSYTYCGSNDLNAVGWYWDNWGSTNYTSHTVGGLAANELGTFDMSGNVWEWVWDIYASYPSGSQSNPTGANSGYYRVCRGGGRSSYAGKCTVLYRDYDSAASSYADMGFRVVRVSP